MMMLKNWDWSLYSNSLINESPSLKGTSWEKRGRKKPHPKPKQAKNPTRTKTKKSFFYSNRSLGKSLLFNLILIR